MSVTGPSLNYVIGGSTFAPLLVFAINLAAAPPCPRTLKINYLLDHFGGGGGGGIERVWETFHVICAAGLDVASGIAMLVFLQQLPWHPQDSKRWRWGSQACKRREGRERVGFLYWVPSRLSSSPHAID